MNPLPESVSPLESHCHDFFASIHPVLLLARPLSSVGLSVSPSSPLVCLPPPPPARCYCTHCGYPSSPGQTNVPCYLRRGCVLQALTLLGHTLTHTHSPGWACLPRRSFASRTSVPTVWGIPSSLCGRVVSDAFSSFDSCILAALNFAATANSASHARQ
jgi:hypothetical protein